MPQDITLVTGIINERLKGGQKCGGFGITLTLFIAGTPVRETQGIESVGAAPTLRTFQKSLTSGEAFAFTAYNHCLH